MADLAYLLPEGAPSTMPFWGKGLQPAPPPGYDYDYLNTDVLLHQTSVLADGRLHVTGSEAMPAGMSYRVLVLPPTTQMTPEVLHKLKELVAAGATITGPRPLSVAEPARLSEGGCMRCMRSRSTCGATWMASRITSTASARA